MKQKQIVCTLAIIMLLLLSCNLMSGAPIGVNTSTPVNRNTDTATTDPQVLIDQAVAETMAAQTQIAISVQQTLAAMVTDTPQFTGSACPLKRTAAPDPGQLMARWGRCS
jgi:hypothetical protein